MGAVEVEDVVSRRLQRRLQQLYLRFRSGEIYCYRDVPVERYQELLAAGSKGEYVRSHIFNHYPYQRIRSAIRTAS